MSLPLAVYAGPACPHCNAPLDLAELASGPQACARCTRAFEAVRFEPVLRQRRVVEVSAAGPGEAASCALHRRNAAVGSCEHCGIFMCALCRTESDGRVLCAGCFDRLSADGTLAGAQTSFRDYTSLAWSAAVLGLVFWLPGILTGPLAVSYALRGLRQSREWGDRGGRGRVVAALAAGVISTVQGFVVLAAILD